jgi:uncharacterized repeat protein (TIGR03806 family)
MLRLFLLFVLALPALAAAQGFPAILAPEPPRLLSEYGFFEGPGINQPAKGLRLYDLVVPLFSDRAQKTRFVHLPVGPKGQFSANEVFTFPVGTALIKNFGYPADFREPDKNVRLVETRLLLRQADGWKALAYVWNEQQTDAELKPAGKRLDVSFIDEAGATVAFSYAVPNRNQCKGCHSVNGEIAPIGPKARNLNKPSPVSGETGNQLEHWAEAGLIDALPYLGAVDRAHAMDDKSASLDQRARSWLDVNCAHCHRREGPASNSGLYLTFGEIDRVALGIGKRPVAAGRGAGDNAFDIVPGHPEQSILLSRMESVEPGVMMPELGRNLADPAAVELIRQWIASLN